jgi:hypothetical protein
MVFDRCSWQARVNTDSCPLRDGVAVAGASQAQCTRGMALRDDEAAPALTRGQADEVIA